MWGKESRVWCGFNSLFRQLKRYDERQVRLVREAIQSSTTLLVGDGVYFIMITHNKLRSNVEL
jgi:hypothetical protein